MQQIPQWLDKPLSKIRLTTIRKSIDKLPPLLLGIVFIVILGFYGWLEYNNTQFIFTQEQSYQTQKSNYDPITPRTVKILAENGGLYNHGNKSELNSVAFSSDGKVLASSDNKGQIKLWKFSEQGDKLSEKKSAVQAGDKDNSVWSISFSPDKNDQTLASWSSDQIFRLWDTSQEKPTEKLTCSLKEKESLKDEDYAMAFNLKKDRTILATGDSKGILKLWDAGKCQEISTLSDDKRNLSDDKRKKRAHKASIYFVELSQDGKTLASGDIGGTIKLWNTENGRSTNTFQNPSSDENGKDNGVEAIAFSPKPLSPKRFWQWEPVASASSDGTIKLWSTRNKKGTILGNHNEVIFLAFNNEGNILASGSRDGTIKLWDPSNRRELRTLRNHPYAVYSLAFSPDDHLLASSSMDETIKLWNVKHKLYLGWTSPPVLTHLIINFS